MTGDEATLAVIEALESSGTEYMLVGSLSSNYYGIPRSTKDADFVIALGERSVRDVTDRLEAQFRLDPQMSFETVTMTPRHILSIERIPFRIELFHLTEDAHDQERFRRRRRVTLPGHAAFMPTAEDVIITKLRWSVQGKRSKDWDDIAGVIAVQGDRLDWDYINSWSDRHGTRTVLEDIRRSIPPI